MAIDPKLSRALDRSELYLKQTRGKIGSMRVVDTLNNFMEIQRHMMSAGKEVKNVPKINMLLKRIRETLGMPDYKDEVEDE